MAATMNLMRVLDRWFAKERSITRTIAFAKLASA
jgi:hypothetical protein